MDNQSNIFIGCLFYSLIIPESTCKILAISPKHSAVQNNERVYFCEITEWGRIDYKALPEKALKIFYSQEKPIFTHPYGKSTLSRISCFDDSLITKPFVCIEDTREPVHATTTGIFDLFIRTHYDRIQGKEVSALLEAMTGHEGREATSHSSTFIKTIPKAQKKHRNKFLKDKESNKMILQK